ncbi:uncharacterized protein C16orf52 homolog A isoform X1 [Eupeodes corollae]|uniref:uncharacterized protein C16orf52 homolog A isoform X1 n=2 Tax=Eupeodes corollae TaxID=290404 RepID=UPI0024904E45|nr:uncharacterized protein C16orf52 homolog A isoform X1 [Eupeodes corollae]
MGHVVSNSFPNVPIRFRLFIFICYLKFYTATASENESVADADRNIICKMDKLTTISATLFMAADVFAIVSLAMPDWIVTEEAGDIRLGLMWTCMTLYNRPQVCFTPELQIEWLLALVCIFVGCICVTTTVILLASSTWDRNVIPYARWVGFTAMVLFCLAAVIFPLGFHVDEIGGQAYQLPNTYKIGISYIMFVLALWITVVSELFAGKVCLPHF